jgi:hypothetical protein
VLKSFDLPDLVAAMSPRPVWIVNGTDPRGHRVEEKGAQLQYAAAQKSFRLANAEGLLKIGSTRPGVSFAETYGDWIRYK